MSDGCDLNDFPDSRQASQRERELRLKHKAEAEQPVLTADCNKAIEYKNALSQWTSTGPNMFLAVGDTKKSLDPGVYTQEDTQKGIFFNRVNVKVDDLMEIPDSLHISVLNEIDDFWTRGSKFSEFGFLHRRGYLLYGPQGSGKTAIVQQVISRIVKSGDIVMLCGHPKTLVRAMIDFRQVEPGRRIVCVFEDLDSIVESYGEDTLLALLDGEHQIDRVLNIATTNYPERLDKRLVARPRRFDRVIKVGMPNAAVRRVYLKAKTGTALSDDELERWVRLSDGLSFAAIAELVISVFCLGNKLEDTIRILSSMSTRKASSDEFEVSKIGIRPENEVALS